MIIRRYLLENVDKFYNNDWSDIPRDIFDKIIVMDPSTDVEKGRLGRFASQLLLPKYSGNGEEEFVEKGEEVTNAINTYSQNLRNYIPQARNLQNFPSVQDFIDFVKDPENSEIAKALAELDTSVEKQKESKIDKIYNQYYKDIDRDIFNKLIALDPETTENSIGTVAKNLLIPKFKNGEKVLEIDPNSLNTAINIYNSEKAKYSAEEKDLNKYDSVEDFIRFVTVGPDSNLIKLLKEKNLFQDSGYIGSTKEYDVFASNTNYEVNHLFDHLGGDSRIIRWCTGYDRGYFNSYRGPAILYQFMYRPDVRDRYRSYQLALYKPNQGNYAYRVEYFLDGNDENRSGKNAEGYFEDFLMTNLDVARICMKDPNLSHNPEVKKVYALTELANKPFKYTNKEDLLRIDDYSRKLIPEIIIDDSVTVVPYHAFTDWINVKKVTLSKNLKRIGAQAFAGCISLKDLTLPDSLEYIGAEAFAGCVSLARINLHLPDNLTYIGERAFYGTGPQFKLGINQFRTKDLTFHPADKDWVPDHVVSLKLKEELEDNLEEDLPFDLSKAYKRSNPFYNTQPSSLRRQSILAPHSEISGRREVVYNYKNANYDEIPRTAEAIWNEIGIPDPRIRVGNQFATQDVEIGGETVTQYIYKGKMPTRNIQLYNEVIENIRVIIDGDVVEVEAFGTDPNRSATNTIFGEGKVIPREKFGLFPLFLENTSRMVPKTWTYKDLFTFLMISDKIYKTDEYAEQNILAPVHQRIKNEPTDTYEPLTTQQKNSTFNVDTFIPTGEEGHVAHNPEANYQSNYKGTVVPDTGSHIKNTRNSFIKTFDGVIPSGKYNDITTDISNAYNDKTNLYKEYLYLKKLLAKMESEKDLYDEEEYDDLYAEFKHKFNIAQQKYLEALDKFKKLQDKILKNFDLGILDIKNRMKDPIKALTKLTKKRYELQQQLSKIKGDYSTNKDNLSPEDQRRYAALDNDLKNTSTEVEKLNKIIAEAEARKADLEREIEEARKAVEQGKVNLDSFIKSIPDKIREFDEFEDKFIEAKDKKIQELTAALDDIEAQIRVIAPTDTEAQNKAVKAWAYNQRQIERQKEWEKAGKAGNAPVERVPGTYDPQISKFIKYSDGTAADDKDAGDQSA